MISIRSRHTAGVQIAAGDASVHFIPSTIDVLTWQRLGARNDGQPAKMP